jgi:predicted ABC-type ATPase
LLAERRSFAVETTLSGRFHLEIARRAKTAGWKVGVLYIGLRSSDSRRRAGSVAPSYGRT